MYGFPTQTVQDTVDALEYVRQLFANGCIQSGFFHRFACTVHSPVGKNPEEYGVTLAPLPPGDFAKNDVAFIDPTGVDHDALGSGPEEGHLQLHARHRAGRRCAHAGSRSRCRRRRCGGTGSSGRCASGDSHRLAHSKGFVR